MSENLLKKLKSIPGIVIKRTKTGQRYLLHDKDSCGKDIYVTLEIKDKPTNEEITEIIQKARIKLNSKKFTIDFGALIEDYATCKNLAASSHKMLIRYLQGFNENNENNYKKIKQLLSSGLKTTTINIRVSIISSFYKWCILTGRLKDTKDPTIGVSIKCTNEPRTRTLNDNEVKLLFDALKKRTLEDQLIIRLAFFTGARISTIYAINKDTFKHGKMYYYNVKSKHAYRYPVPMKDTETIEIYKELCKKPVIFDKKIEVEQ